MLNSASLALDVELVVWTLNVCAAIKPFARRTTPFF
jgi:hypothetical protein